MLIRTALFSVLVLAVSCASQTRTFDIEVHNNSTQPLTLVLAKDAGPKESIWATPEDVSEAGAAGGGQWGIGVVPAGRTASSEKVQGTFPQGTNAYLRIYVGDLTLGDALRVIPGTPQRLDLPLQPGSNQFVVVDKDGGIAIASEADTSTQSAATPTTQPAAAPPADTGTPAK
jgi:hypothetical protein